MDVAVDPIDGTRLVSRGEANALAVVAVAERGAMFNPGPCVYMEKIATGRESASAIDITASVETNIKQIARIKRMLVSEVTMMILDRPRHEEIVERVRKLGARVYLISDGDVAGAISAARRGTGVDLLYGIGGTPEGVVSAAALKCLGGVIQGRLHPRNDQERDAAIAAGYDLGRVLTTDDLVKGRRRVLRCDGRDRRRAGAGRAVLGGLCDHRVDRDEGPLGYHPRDSRRAPGGQAQANIRRSDVRASKSLLHPETTTSSESFMALFSLRNVSLAFGGPRLLDQASLQIERGERLCLLGRNGEGKTTLCG